jgi:hypothetical protein
VRTNLKHFQRVGGDRGRIVEPATGAQVFKGDAEDGNHKVKPHKDGSERNWQHKEVAKIGGDDEEHQTTRSTRKDVVERVTVEECWPFRNGLDFLPSHEREGSFQTEEPNERQVASDHRHGEVLHETGEFVLRERVNLRHTKQYRICPTLPVRIKATPSRAVERQRVQRVVATTASGAMDASAVSILTTADAIAERKMRPEKMSALVDLSSHELTGILDLSDCERQWTLKCKYSLMDDTGKADEFRERGHKGLEEWIAEDDRGETLYRGVSDGR